MKALRSFGSERGDATIIEAILIYPIVFVCILFLIFAGLTFVQRAHLQAAADNLSEYLANCIMYPGYEDLVDPFYGKPNTQITTTERITKAMKNIDPYRYLFGLFGNSSRNKTLVENAKTKMSESYLLNVSFLGPSTENVEFPEELWNRDVLENGGYACGIAANTSYVTVFVAQNFIFADGFKMIGIGNAKMVMYGKSTSNICDCVETVRLADFAFDAVQKIADAVGIDTSKITEIIGKISGKK